MNKKIRASMKRRLLKRDPSEDTETIVDSAPRLALSNDAGKPGFEKVKNGSGQGRFQARVFQQLNYLPVNLLLKMLFSFRVEGRENLAGLEGKPVIFASNHADYMDSLIAAAAMPRNSLVPRDFFPLRFLAAEEFLSVKRNPDPFPLSLLTTFFVRMNGPIPVRRDGLVGLRESMAMAIEALGMGEKLWIYPEGRISPDGRLRRGKNGAAYLHRATGAPVVPVGIVGTHGLMSWKSLLRSKKVTLRFGHPLYSLGDGRLQGWTEKIMAEIAALSASDKVSKAREAA